MRPYPFRANARELLGLSRSSHDAGMSSASSTGDHNSALSGNGRAPKTPTDSQINQPIVGVMCAICRQPCSYGILSRHIHHATPVDSFRRAWPVTLPEGTRGCSRVWEDSEPGLAFLLLTGLSLPPDHHTQHHCRYLSDLPQSNS